MLVAAIGMALGAAIATLSAEPSYAAPRPSLTVRIDNTPEAGIVLDAHEQLEVARFALRSGREDLVVDTLSFQNCVTDADGDADGDCADDNETAGADAAVVKLRLRYTDADGNERRSPGTLVDGVVTFSNLVLPLPRGTSVPVVLSIDTATIDDSAVTSGMQVQFNLNARTADFHAKVKKTGRVLTESHVGKVVAGETMTLRNTAPALTLSDDAPSGAVTPGMTEVFRFDASAGAEGDISLSGVMFALTASDNAETEWDECEKLGADTANFTLTNATTGATIDVTWGISTASGRSCAGVRRQDVVYLYADFTTAETIAAGQTTAYALTVNTSRASTLMNDTLLVTLPDQATLDELDKGFLAVEWSDGTSGGSTIDGGEIDTLPIDGNPLLFQKKAKR